jgi:hypothetical protein
MPSSPTGGASTGFTLNRRIGAAKSKEITTFENFIEGYRSREDTSLLKPETLVAGSHDVLVGTTGRIRSREGYYIDGTSSSVVSVTRRLPDWEMGTGFVHHLRAGGLTSAGNNGQLQLRWIDTLGALGTAGGTYWLPLLTALTSTYFQSTNYWDTTNLKAKDLFVNRTGTIWEWTGAIGTVKSNTTTTVTLNGTQTLAQLKFDIPTYTFTVSSANATSGATYTNNGNTFTVSSTISSGTTLVATGTGVSASSGTLTLATGTGDATITFSSVSATSYSLINNGNVYVYTGTDGNQTFTGMSSLPTFVVNSPTYEQPIPFTFSTGTFTNSITPPVGFTCDLIGVLSTNQVMVASIVNNLVYLSQAGTYKNYAQSTARLQYEGDTMETIGAVTAFSPQENDMYISAGLDEWYKTDFIQTTITDSTTGTTLTFETSQLAQLKTTFNQAAQSQYATTKIANDIVYLSNEPFINSLGRVTNILETPQITNLSYPIVSDMNQYNFTDASAFYFQLKLYVAIPQSGVVIIYNMTNPKAPFWEAPQYLPISGFCAIGNMLIGHSYNTFESYVMFVGYSDRATSANTTGNSINSVALFAFQTLGLRAFRKSMNKFFVEGYITEPTTLNVGLVFRSPQNGVTAAQTLTIAGTGSYVINNVIDNSLGKMALGKNPLGTDLIQAQQKNLPPYFAVIITEPRDPFLSYQPMFYSYGTSQRWELLSFGSNAAPASEMPVDITN